MAEIDELIARLEKASGPDRGLDAEIWLSGKPEGTRQQCVIAGDEIEQRCVQHGRVQWQKNHKVPTYTASLDAAMTLASDGEEYEIANLYGVAMVTLPLNRSDVSSITVRRPDGNVVLAFVQCAMAYRVALRAINSEPSR